MIERTQTIQIKAPFSKGFVDARGNNRIPEQYSPYLRNVRIENGITTIRPWYASKIASNIGTYIRWMASNNSTLYVVTNTAFQSLNLTTGAYTSIWAVPADTDVNILTYDKYTIVYTWWDSYVYDGSSFAVNGTEAAAADLRFWTSFAWYTLGPAGKCCIWWIINCNMTCYTYSWYWW